MCFQIKVKADCLREEDAWRRCHGVRRCHHGRGGKMSLRISCMSTRTFPLPAPPVIGGICMSTASIHHPSPRAPCSVYRGVEFGAFANMAKASLMEKRCAGWRRDA